MREFWALQLLADNKIEAKSPKVCKTLILLEACLSLDPDIARL
jgi:hypothetical protein